MEWTGDVARGAWIRERTHGGSTVTGTVPSGYDRYARVFHPVPVSWMVTDPEEIAAMPPIPGLPEELADAPRYAEEEWTWAQAAEVHGTTMHATAQWTALTRGIDDLAVPGDGRRLGRPSLGHLPPEQLAALVRLLPTTTPDELTIAVWFGWGELNGGSATALLHPVGFSRRRQREVEEEARREREEALDPAVASAVARRRGLLELPDREYVLLTGTVDELADPGWPERAGIGWTNGDGPMPALVWPADRAWCIGSEIDVDSTLVGGTAEAIAAVTQSDVVEALIVRPDDDLSAFADHVNE